MKRLLLTICFLIACQFVNGQTFFNKTYDFEGGNDIGSCLLEADSGYFSTVQIIESGKRNTAIVKLNWKHWIRKSRYSNGGSWTTEPSQILNAEYMFSYPANEQSW